MSAAPPAPAEVPAGVPWYKSSAVRTVLGMAALYLFAWLAESATARSFDWWALLKTESVAIGALLANFFRSDVVAPIPGMNFRNPKVPT